MEVQHGVMRGKEGLRYSQQRGEYSEFCFQTLLIDHNDRRKACNSFGRCSVELMTSNLAWVSTNFFTETAVHNSQEIKDCTLL
jgi:hypothetical protein